MSIVTTEKVLDDIRLVVADAEELLRATAGMAGEQIAQVRARAKDHLATARIKLADLETAAADRAREACRITDDYVRDNPWRSLGLAAGIGFVAGLLIGRQRE
jgi:ElaB/YqjD/DUF883 family membrane-anchored ribosome-binding protein